MSLITKAKIMTLREVKEDYQTDEEPEQVGLVEDIQSQPETDEEDSSEEEEDETTQEV